jgi:hypothetical protein
MRAKISFDQDDLRAIVSQHLAARHGIEVAPALVEMVYHPFPDKPMVSITVSELTPIFVHVNIEESV